MKGLSKKAGFAIFAVLLMMIMPFTLIDVSVDAENSSPYGSDYGFIITTDRIVVGGKEGEGITKVQYGGADKNLITLSSGRVYSNLLYEVVQGVITENTDPTNPNYNEYLSFNRYTGIGPFNAFYVAINIGDTVSNGDLYKSSPLNGQVAYVLNPYNLNEAILSTTGGSTHAYDGNSFEVTYYSGWTKSDYNIMLYIPTVYWHTVDKPDSQQSNLYLSNKKDYFTGIGGVDEFSPDSMVARAHTIEGSVRPYLALGVYEASNLNGTLVSQSGKTPQVNKAVDEFRNMADNLNEGLEAGEYILWNYYQWTLYKMMAYTVIGTKNSQDTIGYGMTYNKNVIATTGAGDEQGPYWGGIVFDNGNVSGSYNDGKSSVKLFLENTWGSCHDLLDDTWLFDGQLHAGQNSIDTINANINPNASTRDGNKVKYGSDGGLNDSQEPLGSAVLNLNDGTMNPIRSTYTNPNYWDFPETFGSGQYSPIGDSVQYSSGNQTLCVGGHYDAQNHGGLNRINVRNGFGAGKADICTRLAYLPYGGVVTYESGDFEVTSSYGLIPSGLTVQKDFIMYVNPTGEDPSLVLFDGNEVVKTAGRYEIVMGTKDAELVVIFGTTIGEPTVNSYIYDGRQHEAISLGDLYTVTAGTNSATAAGDYEVFIAPVAPYTWSDGTNSSKNYSWSIGKKNLIIEGSSAAQITKVYDGTRNMGTNDAGQIQLEDLFVYGLADGELPTLTYTASYRDGSAGNNRTIDVTRMVLGNSDSFNNSNYIYDPDQRFVIVGVGVVITSINMGENRASFTISEISNQSYTGSAITPEPTVIYDGMTLELGRDYTLSYGNNLNVGTATVWINGKGNYSSSISTTFTIIKKVVEWPAIVYYDYDKTTKSVTLEDTVDYTVISNPQGVYIGDYNATLRLIDTSNTTWADSAEAEKTAKAMEIRDVFNTVTFIATPGTKKGDYPTGYYSSQGLVLPGSENIQVYEDPGYDVTFVGWYEEGVPTVIVTQIPADECGSKYYYAKYDRTEKTFGVVFDMQTHGAAIPSQNIAYGQLVERPEDPADIAYNFQGWYRTYSNGQYSNPWDFSQDRVYEETTLFAKWTQKTYTITWKDSDGTTLRTDSNVGYGSTPSYGEAPIKETDQTYIYSFAGWTPALEAVTQDRTYTATYDIEYVPYSITLPNGGPFIVEHVEGDNPNHYGGSYSFRINSNPATPDFSQLNGLTVRANGVVLVPAEGVYTISNIASDVTVAVSLTRNVYTIHWVDESGGSVFDDDDRVHGSGLINHGIPSAPSNPDPSLNYTFTGWTLNGDPVDINNLAPAGAPTSDMTYVAHFDSAVKTFTLEYADSQLFDIVITNGQDKDAVPYGEDIKFKLDNFQVGFDQIGQSHRICQRYAINQGWELHLHCGERHRGHRDHFRKCVNQHVHGGLETVRSLGSTYRCGSDL